MAGIGTRTRGHAVTDALLGAVASGRAPHALLLVGPEAVGKTTLALDVAATLLCTSSVMDRPCGECRACRLVRDGNHPDVHRLAPDGPGGQIRIDHVRALASALALHSFEGGPRVAIVEHADRLNEDAQNAFLKTLEEPPSRVTLVLCASDEDRLLPTIRSRTARIRLGTVAIRALESLLGELALAEPPTAGRIARAAAGLPGRAVTYGRSPDALAVRGEVARTLLDLASASRARRLEVARDLLASGATAGAALDPSVDRSPRPPDPATDANAPAEEGRVAGRAPAAERRRALAWLMDVWTDLARDLVAVALGDPRRVRDPSLLDDLRPLADTVSPPAVASFLERLAETSRRVEANVSPELALDVLLLAWPGRPRGA